MHPVLALSFVLVGGLAIAWELAQVAPARTRDLVLAQVLGRGHEPVLALRLEQVNEHTSPRRSSVSKFLTSSRVVETDDTWFWVSCPPISLPSSSRTARILDIASSRILV